MRANLTAEGGRLVARKFPKDGAGILSSIVQSEGFAILDETVTELAPGASVEFLPFEAVLK